MKGYSLLPPFGGRSRRFRYLYLWPSVISDADFDALERALTHPVKPTKSIIRGAELIRKLYLLKPPPTSIERGGIDEQT